MNVLKKLVIAAACSLAFGTANAAMISVNQEKNPDPDHKVTKTTPTSMTFDLNALLEAYGVTSDDIVSGRLDIFLTDPYDGQERYTITVGAGLQTVNGNGGVQNGSSERQVTILLDEALADLQEDGRLDLAVALGGNTGDFDFARATLTASFEEPVEVPEPASAALLGLGLLGVQLARRRRA